MKTMASWVKFGAGIDIVDSWTRAKIATPKRKGAGGIGGWFFVDKKTAC